MITAVDYLVPEVDAAGRSTAVVFKSGKDSQRIYMSEAMSGIWQCGQLRPILQRIINQAFAAGKRAAKREQV